MAKKLIKEMMVMLLLCLAIILILGVLLYEYVPSNKMIPDRVSYTTPTEVQEELRKGEKVENDEVILTYSITASDLDNYERIYTYVPGKPNPFSSYNIATNSEETTNQNENASTTTSNHNQTDTNSEIVNSTTSSENGTQTNNTTNSGASAYYPDTGTK